MICISDKKEIIGVAILSAPIFLSLEFMILKNNLDDLNKKWYIRRDISILKNRGGLKCL